MKKRLTKIKKRVKWDWNHRPDAYGLMAGSQHNVCAMYIVKHTMRGVTTSVLYAHV